MSELTTNTTPAFFKHEGTIDRYIKLSPQLIKAVEGEVKALLHESRMSMKRQGEDISRWNFSVFNPYYAEAFGVMRGLQILGYGYFGTLNIPNKGTLSPDPRHNLRWWLSELESQVIDSEKDT